MGRSARTNDATRTGIEETWEAALRPKAPDTLVRLRPRVVERAHERLRRRNRPRAHIRRPRRVVPKRQTREEPRRGDVAEAEERETDLDYDAAREWVYGMPYAQWKAEHQRPATPEELAQFESR